MSAIILAVDPGREKCGLAVVTDTTVLARAVVGPGALGEALRGLARRFTVTDVVVGNRTGAAEAIAIVEREWPGLAVIVAEEAGTTLEARRLYFTDHPRRGWRRLIPVGLQLPPEPYDDYAAVVLATRHSAARRPAKRDRDAPGQEETP